MEIILRFILRVFSNKTKGIFRIFLFSTVRWSIRIERSKEGIRFYSWLSVEESSKLEWKWFFVPTDVIVDEKGTRI